MAFLLDLRFFHFNFTCACHLFEKLRFRPQAKDKGSEVVVNACFCLSKYCSLKTIGVDMHQGNFQKKIDVLTLAFVSSDEYEI